MNFNDSDDDESDGHDNVIDVAEKIKKRCKQTEGISDSKRLIVICSTWGEGEQPVNAQDLYDAVSESEDGCMIGVNFAVLALGDTAFEFFCESGKEWDNVLEEKGGQRIIDRIDCDTDYDDYAEDWIREAFDKFKKMI